MSKLPRRIAVVLGLLCFHAIAARAFIFTTGVTVDPPNPTSHDVVHLTVRGQRQLFGLQITASVTPPDNQGLGTIRLNVPDFPALPPPAYVPFAQTVDVGPLPEGFYTVETEDGHFTASLNVDDHTVVSQSLFLIRQRFEVSVAWRAAGADGIGHPQALTDNSGYFWFFDSTNPELLVKVIDGTPVNGHFWVFLGGLSDVDYTVTVTDRFSISNKTRTYTNARGIVGSRADTSAF
jgi:hypothetical protein